MAGMVFSFGLSKIPKVKNIKAVKKIAQFAKDYGTNEGKKVIRQFVNDIDHEFADIISEDIFEFVDDIMKERCSNEKYYNDNDIKVVFLDDEEPEVLLLPSYKQKDV